MFAPGLIAQQLTWVSEPPANNFTCMAKIRYRQEDQDCVIEKIENGTAYIKFFNPQRAITPRQAIVFYQGEACIGGGLILKKGCI